MRACICGCITGQDHRARACLTHCTALHARLSGQIHGLPHGIWDIASGLGTNPATPRKRSCVLVSVTHFVGTSVYIFHTYVVDAWALCMCMSDRSEGLIIMCCWCDCRLRKKLASATGAVRSLFGTTDSQVRGDKKIMSFDSCYVHTDAESNA